MVGQLLDCLCVEITVRFLCVRVTVGLFVCWGNCEVICVLG